MRLFCFGPSMALTPSGQQKLTKIAVRPLQVFAVVFGPSDLYLVIIST